MREPVLNKFESHHWMQLSHHKNFIRFLRLNLTVTFLWPKEVIPAHLLLCKSL